MPSKDCARNDTGQVIRQELPSCDIPAQKITHHGIDDPHGHARHH